jgi:hypothetical protein
VAEIPGYFSLIPKITTPLGGLLFIAALLLQIRRRRETGNSVKDIAGGGILSEKILLEIIRMTRPEDLQETLEKLLEGQKVVVREVLNKVDPVKKEDQYLKAWIYRSFITSGSLLFIAVMVWLLPSGRQPPAPISVTGEAHYAGTNALVVSIPLRVPECKYVGATDDHGQFAFPCSAEKGSILHLQFGAGAEYWQGDIRLEQPYRRLINDVEISGH